MNVRELCGRTARKGTIMSSESVCSMEASFLGMTTRNSFRGYGILL